MNRSVIYFDHNAATPLDAGVRAAMEPFLGQVFGNPSSIHSLGRTARAHLDDAHERMARLLQCKPSEVTFTSGGTESNSLAILGAVRSRRDRGRHLITSAIEHHAVLECFRYLEKHEGYQVDYLPAESNGSVSPESLISKLRDDTLLVSVMAANNETGAVQPVVEIGSICQSKGILFHTDAVQWFGKLPFEGIRHFNADLVSGCAHKLYGPKGAGFLYIKSPHRIEPIIFGGPQENELRAGTENLAQVIGLVTAFEKYTDKPVFDNPLIRKIHLKLTQYLNSIKGVNVIEAKMQLPNTIAFYAPQTNSTAMLANLDLAGICASSGAACNSGALQPSHVLLGMGLNKQEASSLIRLSFGIDNTEDEAGYFMQEFRRIFARLTTCE